jgi:very-short-patch-repair endonuclease
MPLSLEQIVHSLGGVTTRAALVKLTSRAEVDRALRQGSLVRLVRGKYALPHVRDARRISATLHAVASHRTAAQAYGWEMKHPPDRPCLTVGRSRKLKPEQREGIELHWASLTPTEVYDGWLTSPGRTFLDCCRDLPFDEALAIADAILRSGRLTRAQLARLAGTMRGPGAPQARRVAREATALAANPFESVLRAIALDVPGLAVEPQVLVIDRPFPVRPDLVDERLRLAIEADSFAWHSDRKALRRDCQRYTLLAVHGWTLARFAWEDVMHDAEYVRTTLTALVARVDGRADSDLEYQPAA